MSAEAVDQGTGHPVAVALGLVRQGLDVLLDAGTTSAREWSLTDTELRTAVADLTSQASRVQAARAVLLREHITRETPDTRGQQGARTVTLLKDRCRSSAVRASADVANAKVTCPVTGDLRGLGAAWAAGQVSTEHVDVARRVLGRVPRRIVREHRDEIDTLLTEHAKDWDPGSADRLAQHLLSVLAPDRADRYDEHAHERRHLGVSTDASGMVLLRGQLDPAAGLDFTTTMDHLLARDRATGSGGGGGTADLSAAGEEGAAAMPDLRTRGQRRADALAQMAALAAEHLGLTPHPATAPEPDTDTEAESDTEAEPTRPSAGPRRVRRSVPRIVIVTTPDQLAGHPGAGHATATDGTLITHGALTRLACDAVIDRVVLSPTGRVLATDTIGRLATGAQQHALAARDHGCTWPGCTTPPSLCEAHHVIWWSHGGPTTLDNLTLLCHRHHTQIHAQPQDPHHPEGAPDAWQIVMRDGIPWYRPPEHHHHNGMLVRNTFHHTAASARRTGTRWRTPATAHGPDLPPPRPP